MNWLEELERRTREKEEKERNEHVKVERERETINWDSMELSRPFVRFLVQNFDIFGTDEKRIYINWDVSSIEKAIRLFKVLPESPYKKKIIYFGEKSLFAMQEALSSELHDYLKSQGFTLVKDGRYRFRGYKERSVK